MKTGILRRYKCLPLQEYSLDGYKLVPLRDEDKYSIMQWRNDQIKILRQKELLTSEQQNIYFSTVIANLFEQEKPSQLLFSFFAGDVLIGYGGLVHIDWGSKHGEVSFITETKRAGNSDRFIADWKAFLKILKKLVSSHLGFVKIYTYAYDVRPSLFKALKETSFKEEARLQDHISIDDNWHDVLIHSFFFEGICFRIASAEDMILFFQWANDEIVRKNSFNQNIISWNAHQSWFSKKINDESALLLVAILKGKPVGQIRFDSISNGVFEIDFSVAPSYRNLGLGSEIIKKGVEVLVMTKPLFKKAIGKVKKDNIPSCKSFLKAGFQASEQDDSSEISTFYLKQITA